MASGDEPDPDRKVELLADSGVPHFRANWTDVLGTRQVANVLIAYISPTSSPTMIRSQKDLASTEDWDIVMSKAQEYAWAEHPQYGGTPKRPLTNWPHSNYAFIGTNSDTFIRWLVREALGSTMAEMQDLWH